MVNLARQFETIRRPDDATSDLRFSAAPVDAYPRHRIAVDRHGLPALLIHVEDAEPTAPPLVLEHIRMQQGLDCRITDPNGLTETKRYTIVRCRDQDLITREYFLRVGGTVLDALGDEPTGDTVSATIGRLVELFRALSAPPRKSVIGFWAELFVIARADRPATLVRAWHQQPEEQFDFATSGERIEVKAAIGRMRRHHFSLEQLLPTAGVETVVASVMTERSTGGTSVGDLLKFIRDAVATDAEQLLRIDTLVALTLGTASRIAMDDCFDEHLARESLMFLPATVIPRPCASMPPEITEVHFVSDLSACAAISPETDIAASDLFAPLSSGGCIKKISEQQRKPFILDPPTGCCCSVRR